MNILIIRLSAMGDVALTVPVLKTFTEQQPNNSIFLLTKTFFNPLFSEISDIEIINPDFNNKHKGIFGLYKLYKEIKTRVNPDIVIDLHDVLRTKFIRFMFRLSGIKTVKINKGRKEKKRLTRRKNKLLKPLKHTASRYKETFERAGFTINLNQSFTNSHQFSKKRPDNISEKEPKEIGIAPFAKHIQKQYPIEKTKILIRKLSKEGYKIFLFGGGKKEKEIAEKIAENFSNVTSLIGKLPLEEEIEFINRLDVMITPDSGNMHIAALTSVKIISIWGATHPFAGFTAFVPENRHYIVQNEQLTCRPCSVFGNKECYKKTLECLNTIEPEEIFNLCKKITG